MLIERTVTAAVNSSSAQRKQDTRRFGLGGRLYRVNRLNVGSGIVLSKEKAGSSHTYFNVNELSVLNGVITV